MTAKEATRIALEKIIGSIGGEIKRSAEAGYFETLFTYQLSKEQTDSLTADGYKIEPYELNPHWTRVSWYPDEY